ncbi:MAG: TrkH family potassium uptake protein, partial [Halanaerobiaceae bacterium]
LDFTAALFTATSATCVTGLIVVNTSTAFTVFGQLVIMLLIQVGGLGIMTMSTMIAFIVGKKISLKERLILQEDLNQFSISGVVRLVQYVLMVTLIIEAIGAFIMFLRLSKIYKAGQALYFSIFHAISAFNNAGFDLFGNSLENFTGDIIINFVVIILIILGGIGFAVIAELYNSGLSRRGFFNKTGLQTKIVLAITAFLLIVGFIGILSLEYSNDATMGTLPLGEKILSSVFLSVTPRTAGFNTIPTGSLRSSTLFLLIVLMFIGASPGSTGGGIKTTTFGVLLLTVWSLITGKRDIEVFHRQLEKDIVYKSLAITMLALILVVMVTMILTVIEGMDFLPVFFETVSAFGTVGLSTGVTPDLSFFGRVLITITMFVGRVGPLTMALAFAERQRNGVYHYPKEKIMVG